MAHRTGTVRSYRLPLSPFPCLPLCFEGLAVPSPSIPFLGCLGWRGFGIAGALGLGWLPLAGLAGRDSVAWLACGDWLPPENGPKTFLKKSLARDGKAVSINTQRGEHRRAKQTNERNEMTTQDLQAAEASAFTAKQAAFRAYFAAAGTEAEQAASEAYAAAFRAYVAALDAWTASVKGGAL